jgi:exodeoxyribonuclease V alpha subunit
VGYGRDLGKRSDGRWLRREDIDENLELAYAVSIHKAQGSEFDRVYFVVPKHKQTLLSRELFYTGLTRAARHCTLLIEEDISPLLSMRRLERSRLLRINASLSLSGRCQTTFVCWAGGMRKARSTPR